MSHHLWATAFHPREMHAAGDYPSQSDGDGVSLWVQKKRSLVNTDLVLWYTLGVTHLPAAEEWPVMPAAKIGFNLKPMGFFTHNPSLSLPETATKQEASVAP